MNLLLLEARQAIAAHKMQTGHEPTTLLVPYSQASALWSDCHTFSSYEDEFKEAWRIEGVRVLVTGVTHICTEHVAASDRESALRVAIHDNFPAGVDVDAVADVMVRGLKRGAESASEPKRLVDVMARAAVQEVKRQDQDDEARDGAQPMRFAGRDLPSAEEGPFSPHLFGSLVAGVDHAKGPDQTVTTVTLDGIVINPKRPTFADVYRELAKLMARRSTCSRLSVGAVITSHDHRYVYGVGYNGNASGLPNSCDSSTPGNCGCLHAEANAIINCRVERTAAKRLYLTDSPCLTCAKMIINLGGVTEVNYLREYRITAGLDALRAVGIDAFQLKEG